MNTEGMAEKWEAGSKETKVYTVDDAQVGIMKSDPPADFNHRRRHGQNDRLDKRQIRGAYLRSPAAGRNLRFRVCGDTARRSFGRCDHADQVG